MLRRQQRCSIPKSEDFFKRLGRLASYIDETNGHFRPGVNLTQFYEEYNDYTEISKEEYFYLILQFEIEPFEGELPSKYHDALNNIGNTLHSVLTWNAVGSLNSWNAGETENIKGKYVINFFCIVINTDIAFRLILNEVIENIKDDIDLSHVKIASIAYIDNGEDYNLLYSSDSSTDFSIQLLKYKV